MVLESVVRSLAHVVSLSVVVRDQPFRGRQDTDEIDEALGRSPFTSSRSSHALGRNPSPAVGDDGSMSEHDSTTSFSRSRSDT